jgi:hypothetical protein
MLDRCFAGEPGPSIVDMPKNSFQNDRMPCRRRHKPAVKRSFEQSDPENSRMSLDAVGERLSLDGALSDAPKVMR